MCQRNYEELFRFPPHEVIYQPFGWKTLSEIQSEFEQHKKASEVVKIKSNPDDWRRKDNYRRSDTYRSFDKYRKRWHNLPPRLRRK